MRTEKKTQRARENTGQAEGAGELKGSCVLAAGGSPPELCDGEAVGDGKRNGML